MMIKIRLTEMDALVIVKILNQIGSVNKNEEMTNRVGQKYLNQKILILIVNKFQAQFNKQAKQLRQLQMQ